MNYGYNPLGNGFQPNGCGCGGPGQNNFPAQPCASIFPPYGCGNGCPIQLDSNCVIYHKCNDQISGLVNLGLTNGATAQLIFDSIDPWIGYLKASLWSIPFLRAVPFTITTLPQFATAVDTELSLFSTEIATLTAAANTPITPVDSTSIDLSVSGSLNHTLTGVVKISATASNQVSIVSDGLLVAPQTLSISGNNLTISSGNTVDFSALLCQTGWQGNVTVDPSGAVDGDYWFRTDLSAASGLKIKVNGAVRTITTT